MLRITELRLPLDHDSEALSCAITERLSISREELFNFTIALRSYDARRRGAIKLIYNVDVDVRNEQVLLEKFSKDNHVKSAPDLNYQQVAQAPDKLSSRPIVIGTGPCGVLAGLILAQMGFKPIILERGKDVRRRTKDTWALWREGKFNPESNVQFGEGGAGTFSDGKLHSQIKDRRNLGRKVLEEFVAAGAPDEILYLSKPHIGTFRLVSMVEKIRHKIEVLGGEIRFDSRVSELDLYDGAVKGVKLASGEVIASDHVILAIGHSARDTLNTLYEQGVYMEAKPFSIGFRIEHPQSMIDQERFGDDAGNPLLGSADYKLVHHCKNGRSVYSFCMCPGGTVVAATSEEGCVVTNGMSQYSRNERNANSGIVVGITPDDYPSDHPLAGIELQRQLETRAYELGGSNYQAPGQRLGDFLNGKSSSDVGKVEPSYTPGVHLTDLTPCLPEYAIEALREAIPAFDRKIKGYALADAMLTGVETRTSSPVCLKRGKQSLQSINTPGLYPAGEGAGYAGGILSAAVDGIKAAEAVALSMLEKINQ